MQNTKTKAAKWNQAMITVLIYGAFFFSFMLKCLQGKGLLLEFTSKFADMPHLDHLK